MEISEVLLLLGLLALVFWQRPVRLDRAFIFSILAGFMITSLGIVWLDDYQLIGLGVFITGLVFITSALMVAISEGGPARGWSQVRGWYKRVRGSEE